MHAAAACTPSVAGNAPTYNARAAVSPAFSPDIVEDSEPADSVHVDDDDADTGALEVACETEPVSGLAHRRTHVRSADMPLRHMDALPMRRC